MLIIRNGRASGGRLLALVITAVMTLVSFDAVAAIVVTKDGMARSHVLRYDGARLENPVAAQKLYRRLQIAARKVCHLASDESSNGRAATACEKAAVTQAVSRVNHASITAIHRARMGAENRYNAWLTSPTPCAQCG